MLEILSSWPGLVLIIVIATAAGLYIPWLEEHYHCTAFTVGGVAAGIGFWFFWMIASDSIIAGVIAAVIAFLLFLSNFGKCNSLLHGILMTLWQLLFGFIIMAFFITLNSNKKKKN